MSRIHVVSFSELSDARQCPHKHELNYKERWQSPTTKPALSRGTLWHKVMEQHYLGHKAGNLKQGMANALALLSSKDGDVTEEQDLVYWMYSGYLELYGDDPQWEVLAVEHTSEIWLPTVNGGRSNYKLKIKIDLIVRWKGKIWIIDHKSGKDLPKDKELALDDQFGLYVWGMRAMGKKVFGAMHNAARTQRNKTPGQTIESRFSRTLMNRTQAELDVIAVEAYKTMRRIYQIPAGEAERSPNPDQCTWKCDFLEPCLAGRKGIDERVFLSEKGFVQNYERH